MNTQKASQDDTRGTSPHPQAAARTGPEDGQSAEEMKAHGDRHAIAQAARAVMHPERHELEWRFYHGAVNG
jgi:hypothetical protein